MGHLFRRTWRDSSGRVRKASRWTAQVRLHDAVGRARIALFTNRRASEAALARIEDLIACRASGAQLDAEQQRWILSLPKSVSRALQDCGVIDGDRLELLRPIAGLVADFEEAMLARGTTRQHARESASAASRVLRGSGATLWSEIRPGAVEAYLARLRDGDGGVSYRTSNKLAGAARAFTRWVVRSGWAPEDPLRSLRALPVDADRRRVRRPFTVEEVRAIVSAADHGPVRYGMPGRERAALYLLAVETGLRRGELSRLRRGDIELGRLSGCPGFLLLPGAAAKNRRGALFPLRPATLDRLLEIAAGYQAEALLFRVPQRAHLALQEDMAEAMVQRVDDAGRVADFHSFRFSTALLLARAGLPVGQVQKFLRHSTPTLTYGTYIQLAGHDTLRALEMLPEIDPEELR